MSGDLRSMAIIFLVPIFLVPGVFFVLACLAEPMPSEAPDAIDLLASSPFSEATFEYSNQPEKTIVFVSIRSMSGYERTISLYGDGRLIFRKARRTRIFEEEEILISHQAIRKILRTAVDYGLAEWDLTRVQSKQLENNNGRLYTAVPSDASWVAIRLSLDRYERGEYRTSHLEKEIQFQGASFVERFYPPILEIRGILEVQRELSRLRKEVRQ